MNIAIRSMIYALGLRLKSGALGIVVLLPLGFFGVLLFISKGSVRNEMFNVVVALESIMMGALVSTATAEGMRRYYLLPLTTRQLVTARLIVDVGSAFVLSLSTSLITMLLCGQSEWPVFQLALFVAAVTPLSLGIAVGFRQSPGLQILGMFIAVFAVIVAVSSFLSRDARHLPPESQMDNARSMLVVAGGLFTIVGSCLAYEGVKRDRKGAGWQLPLSVTEFFVNRSEKLPPIAASYINTLGWFQRAFAGTRYLLFSLGFFLVTVIVGTLFFPGGLYSFPSDTWARTFMGIIVVEFLLISWMGGLRCGTTEDKSPGYLQTVYANLPLTDRQMAHATLVSGIKTLMPAAVLITVVQAVFGVVTFSHAVHPNFLVKLGENHWTAIPIQMAAVLLLSWILFGNCFWTWISGRVSLFFYMLVVIVVSLYTAGLPRWVGPSGETVRDVINAATSIALSLLCVWMTQRAKQMGFVDQKSIRRMVVGWLAAYGFTLLTIAYAESVLELSDHYDSPLLVTALIANAIASLAILPIPASRMAIFWNRHRV